MPLKSEQTANAVVTAGSVGGSTILGPHLVQPLLAWIFDILDWIWPGIPLPDTNAQWSLATLVCGIVAAIVTYWLQQRAVNVAVNKTTEMFNQQRSD